MFHYLVREKESKTPVTVMEGFWRVVPLFENRRDARDYLRDVLYPSEFEIVRMRMNKKEKK